MRLYALILPIFVCSLASCSKSTEAERILATLDSLDVENFDQSNLDSLTNGLISSDNAVSKTVQKVSNTITSLKNTIAVLNEKVQTLENEVKELKNENSALKKIVGDSTVHATKPFEFFSRSTKNN